jgi:hypothetical protein
MQVHPLPALEAPFETDQSTPSEVGGDRAIARGREENGSRWFAVASPASHLLVIPVNGLGEAGVYHRPKVRLVDAEPKGGRSNYEVE